MTKLTELKFNEKGEVTNLEGRIVDVIPVGKPFFRGGMDDQTYLRMIKGSSVPESANAFMKGDTKVLLKYGSIAAVQYYRITENNK